MPELIEQMYCSQQIVIPPKFPYILKRFCKAAIKTQPYDLLRWSFEYFKALAERRPPPVKLRLEYPVYSTEGGLTRGCLKVLANQLLSMKEVPLPVLKSAWRGFCLDPNELVRIFCLCEAHLRKEAIPFLKFIAVAGGLLTKSLTHTMILLCETLTKEPDGGSAAIPVEDFLEMYTYLARMRADKDVRYIDGHREGDPPTPVPEPEPEPEEESESSYDSAKLHEMSEAALGPRPEKPAEVSKAKEEKAEKKKDGVQIIVFDEEGVEIPYEFYGQPEQVMDEFGEEILELEEGEEEHKNKEEPKETEEDNIKALITSLYKVQKERRKELEEAFYDISEIVGRFKSANYDLGMVAGRQMSITSGEFIVQNIEKEIMDYIDEQIAILPDPDLKKKKAKPEEVEMVRELLETMVDETLDSLGGEKVAEEEEETAVPDIVTVYAVPGIGPAVPEDIIADFEDYATDVCRVQADMFMPRNIRHFLCPPLEKYEEYKYDEYKKEELPTAGALTE